MNVMKKFFFLLIQIVISQLTGAQQITTATPFLTINTDIRSLGMGNSGVALSPSVYAQFSNAAQYAFMEQCAGTYISFQPWLREAVDGQNLYALGGFYKLNSKSSLSFSGRYFSSGDFEFYSMENEYLGETSCRDYAIDMAYSRRILKYFGVALTVRLIHNGVGDIQDYSDQKIEGANAFAADVAFYYSRPIQWLEKKGKWNVGLQMSNIGTKLKSYGSDSYLPAMLKLGVGGELVISKRQKLELTAEISRLMVQDETDGMNTNSSLANILRSFQNPDFGKSLIWSLGGNYAWSNMINFRIGYFHESESYGNRQYLTIGTGINIKSFGLDGAWFSSVSDKNAPYKNSWSIGLNYRF